jgi:hypothetical protein
MRRESNPRASTRTDEAERCWSWELHLPWLKALLASGLLTGLIKPPLQHPRRWGTECGRAGGALEQVRKVTA